MTSPRAAETITTTAAKVTVVSGEELRETGERSLPRAIGRASGVWIQETNLGGGAPVIRGLLGSQVLILVDGVRVNDSTTRFGPNQSLNTIDPHTVERVEIVRGARSLLYGSDAIGGAVLIWTRSRKPLTRDADPSRPALGGELAGSYDSSIEGGDLSAAVSFATDDHGLLFIGSLHNYNDLRSGDGETVPFTGYHGQNLFASWEYALGRGRTLRATGRVHRDFNVPRTDRLIAGFGQTEPANEEWEYALQDRRAYQLTYTEVERDGFADSMQARFSLRSYEERRAIRTTGSTILRNQEDQVDTVGLGLDWKKLVGSDHLFTWGLDIDSDDVDSFARRTDMTDGEVMPAAGAFAPGARYTAMGAFVQDEVLTFDPWFLTLGARYSFYDFSFSDQLTDESISGNFDALVFSVEAARDIAQGVTMTATVAQGFRAPNLEDLANTSDFQGGVEIGNPDLDPEKSLMGELAVAVRKSIWGGTLAAFVTRIDDLIGRTLLDLGDPDVSGDEVYLRDNNGEALIHGLEAALDVKLFSEASEYALFTSAAYVRGRQYEDVTDPMSGETVEASYDYRRIPPLHGRAGVRYEGDYTRNHVDWAEVYILWATEQEKLHPQDVLDPRIDPQGTPGWVTLNLEIGGPLTRGATWQLAFHNVLDKLYRVHASGHDARGAALVIGVKASF